MALELQSVSRVVKGQVHIQPTTLTLEKGTMNVLLGPTLSGKTSLMRVMAGLDVPTSGRVMWHGQDVTGQRVQDRKVAMVYQQFINYPAMSVYDNIASPMRLMSKSKAEIDRAVRETAELLKLTPMLARKPLELSGGQQQRVAIARMLMQRPELVLADEPDASLDPQSGEDVMRLLSDLARQDGLTLIIISHRLEHTLAFSDRIIGLSGGVITLDVATSQADPAMLRRFFDKPTQ